MGKNAKHWRRFKQNPQENLNQTLYENSKNYEIASASFIQRLKAQIVDIFMIYIPILYLLTYVVIGNAKDFRESIWGPLVGVLLYGVIVSLFLKFKSQTPGKKAYDLLLIRDDGKKVTFFFAFVRFILFLISSSIIIGVLSPLWRKDKKTMYDLILKTSVVSKS
ncbi:RDD family protein [Helicobacter mesocricetorum]|uniref:RDD family protein n=1 Tax=Helicobacter mesocricetorum TaxID=87012 RepID=UPI000CF1C702|nr:RDD family protein [Helicobacter mesocricetorum]